MALRRPGRAAALAGPQRHGCLASRAFGHAHGGTGSLVFVNSWGYASGTSASCVFSLAKNTTFAAVPTTDGNEGGIFTGNCP
jgi:hypothetical protein